MADTYEIPIKRRHYAGQTALEAGSLGVQHWAYDETNERFGVKLADSTYRYHSRSELFPPGAGVLSNFEIGSSAYSRFNYYEDNSTAVAVYFRKRRTTGGLGATTLAGEDSDSIAILYFSSYNDNATPETLAYSYIWAKIVDASDGSEDGQMLFYTMKAGTSTNTFELKSGLLYADPLKTTEGVHGSYAYLQVDTSTGQIYALTPA